MCCYCRSPWKCKTRWWLEQSHLASFKARYPETALVGGTQNRVGKVWLPPRIRIFLTFKWQLQNYVNYLEFFIRFHQSLHSFEEWTQDVFFSFLLSPCFFWFSNRKVKWTILHIILKLFQLVQGKGYLFSPTDRTQTKTFWMFWSRHLHPHCLWSPPAVLR